ncbi:MAG: VirB4 family type IV secretion/conjugal transfer ATPase [Gammaproteobacteria bacterium]|nr:VirB4 family type IV secretion/conjugal transfer ATPase [Gammaproteobacteria bacterium]
MSHSNLMQAIRKEAGISTHIPVTHLNSPTVAETQDGMVFSVLKVDGVPFQTERNESINHWNNLWQRLVASLDENICLTVTIHRRKVNHHLEGAFTNETLQNINDAYMQRFQSRALFSNTIYITILYRGLNSGKVGKSVQLWNRLSDSVAKEARQYRRRQQMRELEKIVDRMAGVLSIFKPAILGSRDNEETHSELLEFLSIVINGGKGQVLPNHGNFSPVSNSIADNIKIAMRYPYGNIAQYLPINRIFFGESIQFQGLTQNDNRFGSILSIKSYPEESASVALNTLMHLEGEWISTHTFAIEAKDVMMKKVKLQGNKLKNVNDAGLSQIDALGSLQELIQTGAANAGYHHHTLMLLADDQSTLDYLTHQAARCYLEVGFPIVRETLGQEAAFWAQIPGNLHYIARSCLITSQNFADFCPLHNYHVGYRDGNHLGAAVTLLETTSKTAYFFNFHKSGSKTEMTPGHTTIIGSNGAGKTVLMTFLDAQVSRYHGRSVFFDRDRGAEIYVRASGGVYSILSPDHPEESCFNPLLLEDTAVNRQFCQDWLAQLCKKESETTLDAELLEPLSTCIDYAFEKLLPEHRQLSNAIKVIPINFPRWPQLRRWLKAEGKREAGAYGYLFDNYKDSLQSADKIGFDMTHFLDNEPPQVRTALLMYLFHWIRSKLDGRLMAIWLDEAWQYFTDAYWEGALKKTLPTFRKLNAFLVMATQSASSVAQSSLRNIILDNSATQIFFPNPDGRSEYYQEGFSLTESEFLFIKENEAKSRQFLVKQGHGSVIVRLDLGHMRHLIGILSADKKSIQRVDQLRQKYGNEPNNWLPYFIKKDDIV